MKAVKGAGGGPTKGSVTDKNVQIGPGMSTVGMGRVVTLKWFVVFPLSMHPPRFHGKRGNKSKNNHPFASSFEHQNLVRAAAALRAASADGAPRAPRALNRTGDAAPDPARKRRPCHVKLRVARVTRILQHFTFSHTILPTYS